MNSVNVKAWLLSMMIRFAKSYQIPRQYCTAHTYEKLNYLGMFSSSK